MANSTDRATREARFLSVSFPTFRQLAGNLGWPILLKELRADFRKNRFFLTHSICLAVLGVGILYKVWDSQSQKLTSVQIGRTLFDTFFVIQYLVVLIVFPAFTATAFTEERSRRSFDLLMTTDLRPSEVVCGKFLATSGYCLITVFATVPLLAISTLFGGVTFGEIVAAYGILIGLTVLIAMAGVFLSSCFSSNLRSTLAVYSLVCLCFAASLWMWGLERLGWDGSRSMESGPRQGGQTIVGEILDGLTSRRGTTVSLFAESAAWGIVLVGIAVFSYLFVLTTNRVRPASDDRSSRLRLLTLVVILLYVCKGILAARWYAPMTSSRLLLTHLEHHVWLVLLALFGVALLFPTESLQLTARVRRRFSRLSGALFPLRIFAPGAFWGLAYLIAVTLIATGGLYWIWSESAASLGEERERWRQVLLTAPVYFYAFGALAFALSAWGFTQGYNALTVFFIFVITSLFPVILWFKRTPDSIYALYYLSPVTLYHSLGPIEEDAVPQFVLFGRPIIEVARWALGGIAILLTSVGIVLARREGLALARLGRDRARTGRAP